MVLFAINSLIRSYYGTRKTHKLSLRPFLTSLAFFIVATVQASMYQRVSSLYQLREYKAGNPDYLTGDWFEYCCVDKPTTRGYIIIFLYLLKMGITVWLLTDFVIEKWLLYKYLKF